MANKNADYKQMPIGFMMSLAQNSGAMENYSRLDNLKQRALIQYISDSSTGEEAKNRIKSAVENLEQNNTGFLG